jgi:hypothetical protein
LRLPQPGGSGPHIYIPQEQGDPVTPPGSGFTFCHLLQLTGLWCRYSNPPPNGILSLSPYLQLACNARYIPLGQTHRKDRSFSYPWERVCIAQQSVVYQESVSEGTCLPIRCLAVDVSLDFTIPAFRRHVTMYSLISPQKLLSFSIKYNFLSKVMLIKIPCIFHTGFTLSLSLKYMVACRHIAR